MRRWALANRLISKWGASLCPCHMSMQFVGACTLVRGREMPSRALLWCVCGGVWGVHGVETEPVGWETGWKPRLLLRTLWCWKEGVACAWQNLSCWTQRGILEALWRIQPGHNWPAYVAAYGMIDSEMAMYCVHNKHIIKCRTCATLEMGMCKPQPQRSPHHPQPSPDATGPTCTDWRKN